VTAPQRANQPQRRRPNPNRPAKPVDLWRPVPALDEPEKIATAPDPAALVRSLGDPPLRGSSVVAGHYIAAVVETAARRATALAALAGLLATDDPDAG
jgi:hypothetical protein